MDDGAAAVGAGAPQQLVLDSTVEDLVSSTGNGVPVQEVGSWLGSMYRTDPAANLR